MSKQTQPQYESPAAALATDTAQPAHVWGGSRFKRVRVPFCLNWPANHPEPRHRGRPGYVIDTELEQEAGWCNGQYHKFEDAPDATQATVITSGKAKHEIGLATAAKNPPPKRAQYEQPTTTAPKSTKKKGPNAEPEETEQ